MKLRVDLGGGFGVYYTEADKPKHRKDIVVLY